jgi:hypothetical protein
MKYKISLIKTKAQFQRAHKWQWNLIIEKASNKSQQLGIIKLNCYDELFDEKVIGLCFGCKWKIDHDDRCLFNIKTPCDFTAGNCLDGLYSRALYIFKYGSKAEKISIAEKIRDFPAK